VKRRAFKTQASTRYCNHCGNWVTHPNFVGLCRICAKFEIPWRTQAWVWFCDLFRKER